MRQLKFLLKGGMLYDGTAAPPIQADIGIAGDRIVFAGDARAASVEAEETVDADGLAVAPGFIDTHAHSEFTLLADPRATGKVLQGITTEINGNCGLSAAPLMGEARERREADIGEYDIPERWETFQQYFAILEARRPSLNAATLAGQGNIRASVFGYVDRSPSSDEMHRMKDLLGEALSQGALGMSTGLIYPPGVYTGTQEIIELARHGYGLLGDRFIYTSHMRSEGDALLESLEETLRIGREAGVRVHVSHIKTSGRENWHKVDECIGLLERARAEGIGATCDRYPYTAGSTDLDAALPPWTYEGGNEAELGRLRDPETRKRIIGELPPEDERWDGVVVSSVESDANRWMEGESVSAIGRRLGRSPHQALIDILIDEQLRVGAIFHGMSEENMKRFLGLPYCMVGSDSSSRCLDGPTRKGKPHPRGFGSFPRYLSMFADGLPAAIHRITQLPALTFGLEGRGLVREGSFADLTVFDTRKVRDTATYTDPFRTPEGIRYVLVNGSVVVRNGEYTGERPGRVLYGFRT